MTRLSLRTSSRLHFGLLSWGTQETRQFGGVGLMIESPGLTIDARPAESWSATGPLASRVLEFAIRSSDLFPEQGFAANPLAFEVRQAPPEHFGLGVGTQLGLGVARLVSEHAGLADPSLVQLALLSGRGLRSGIGLHGFAQGGLIVDGGRLGTSAIPPLLTRLEFPREWEALVVILPRDPGLHGQRELQAFASLPPSPDVLTDRLCRLILLGLLPAVVECDLTRFGDSLEEIQRRVGAGFALAQGGIFAHPELEVVVAAMRAEGLHGVGQSSWGPALYGFSDAPLEDRIALRDRLNTRLGLEPSSSFWTKASSKGASIQREVED